MIKWPGDFMIRSTTSIKSTTGTTRITFCLLLIACCWLFPSLTRASETTYYLGSVERTYGDSGTLTSEKVYIPAGNATVLKNRITEQPSNPSTTTNYLYSDHLGSTVLVTNDKGVKETTLQYYPFGSISNQQLAIGQLNNDKLFTGQRKDYSSDLYFYNARYYNPTTGNFISADKAQGPNRYAYVGNNPVMRNDPSGNLSITNILSPVMSPLITLLNNNQVVNDTISNYQEKQLQNKQTAFSDRVISNKLLFNEGNNPNYEFNSTKIYDNSDYNTEIDKIRSNLVSEPVIRHAYLNAGNQKEFESEYLEPFTSIVNQSITYNPELIKANTDKDTKKQAEIWSKYDKMDFGARLKNNYAVCLDFAVASNIILNENGIKNRIVRGPKMVNGENFRHAFNLTESGVAVDTTWNTIMPLVEDARIRQYLPSTLRILDTRKGGFHEPNYLSTKYDPDPQ